MESHITSKPAHEISVKLYTSFTVKTKTHMYRQFPVETKTRSFYSPLAQRQQDHSKEALFLFITSQYTAAYLTLIS